MPEEERLYWIFKHPFLDGFLPAEKEYYSGKIARVEEGRFLEFSNDKSSCSLTAVHQPGCYLGLTDNGQWPSRRFYVMMRGKSSLIAEPVPRYRDYSKNQRIELFKSLLSYDEAISLGNLEQGTKILYMIGVLGEFAVSQQLIGQAAGVTRETASRRMTDLEKEGRIYRKDNLWRLTKKALEEIDARKLRKLVHQKEKIK